MNEQKLSELSHRLDKCRQAQKAIQNLKHCLESGSKDYQDIELIENKLRDQESNWELKLEKSLSCGI